jgi:O-antigen/teichoic acid export membrane protein
MSKKLILNSLSGTGLYLVNIVMAFVMSPVMVKALGNSDYGLWEMVVGVVGYMGLLDLGVGPALLRHVAVAYGREDYDDLQETMSTAMTFFLGVGLLAMLLFLGLSAYPQILSGKAAGADSFGLVLVLFAVNAFLVFPTNVCTAILMGLQKHHFINFSRCVITVVRAPVAIFLLYRIPGKGLLVLVSLEILINSIQFTLYVSALLRDKTLPRFSPRKFTKNKMLDLFGYGMKSSLLMAASRLQFASMPFIIGKALGVGFIVYFVLPNRLVDYAKGFAIAIGFPLTPYFSDMIGKKGQEDLKAGWLTTSFALQTVTLAAPLFLLFCGENFLGLWIGAEYAAAGHWVLYALLLGLCVEAFSPNARQILLAKAQHGRVAVLSLVMSIGFIPLAYFGARLFGVAGAALVSSMATVVIALATLLLTCRVMATSPLEYLLKTFWPLAVPLVFLGTALWGGGRLLHPHGYLGLFLQAAAGAAVYLIAVWKLSLPRTLRRDFIGRLSGRLTGKKLAV